MGSSGGGGPPCRVGRSADSAPFSFTVLTSGYDKQEVDAFCRAVHDAFLGIRKLPVTSGDVRHRRVVLARLAGL